MQCWNRNDVYSLPLKEGERLKVINSSCLLSIRLLSSERVGKTMLIFEELKFYYWLLQEC